MEGGRGTGANIMNTEWSNRGAEKRENFRMRLREGGRKEGDSIIVGERVLAAHIAFS